MSAGGWAKGSHDRTGLEELSVIGFNQARRDAAAIWNQNKQHNLLLPDLNHKSSAGDDEIRNGTESMLFHFSYTLYTDSYDDIINNSVVL